MHNHKLYTSQPIVNPNTDAFISDNSVFLNQLTLPVTPPTSPPFCIPIVSPRKLGETRETPGVRTLHNGFLHARRAVLCSSDLPTLRTVPPPSPTPRILNLPIREDMHPQHNHSLINPCQHSSHTRSFLESCSVGASPTSSHPYTHRTSPHLRATSRSTALPSPTPGHHGGPVSGTLPLSLRNSARARSSHTVRLLTTTLPRLTPLHIPGTPPTSALSAMSEGLAQRPTPREGPILREWSCMSSGAKCTDVACSPSHNITIHSDSRYASAFGAVVALPQGHTSVRSVARATSKPHPLTNPETASHCDIQKDTKGRHSTGYLTETHGTDRQLTCENEDAATLEGEKKIASSMVVNTHNVIKPMSLANIYGVSTENHVDIRPKCGHNVSSGRLLALSRSLKGERVH